MKRKFLSAAIAFALVLSFVPTVFPSFAADAETGQIIVTEYGDLWEADISVQVGKTVKWYVNVPEGTTPKGCRATIKIPGLGWGTDSHNKEEGHLTLTEGNNFVYEFTPDKTGDILFTCWMGSGCHSNYIHVTEGADGEAPADDSASEEAPADDNAGEAAPDDDSAIAAAPADDNAGSNDIEASPHTGDNSGIIFPVLSAFISAAGLFAVLTYGRKKYAK